MFRFRPLGVATATLLVLLVSSDAGVSCTILGVPGPDGSIRFVGKSYDWATQAAILNANPPGLEKRAFLFPSTDPNVPTQPVIWTSQYPSVTINQYGRDFPLAGMNDHGLVVETAEMDPGSNYLDGANYLPPGATEVITSNQWVQYILDRYESVEAFLADAPAFAIMYSKVPIHFMICDTAECVVVEIRNKDLQITRGLDLGVQTPAGAFIPVPVLTNDYYHCSVNGRDGSHAWALRDYDGFGGTRTPIPSFPGFCDGTNQEPGKCDTACRSAGAWIDADSVQRFVRGAAESRSLAGSPNADVSAVFDSLNEVYSASTETGGTKVQLVYDPRKLEIHWRTVADGTDDTSPNPQGMTGTPRSVSINDFLSRGLLGPCKGATGVQVASIDGAAACPAPANACRGGEPYVCNPTPQLASRIGQPWPWVGYQEAWNTQLVSFAATHSSIATGDFSKMITDRLSGISDAAACQIMFNIWGGYPRGYTACGETVAPEQVVNLFLSSALDPYLTPQARAALDDPLSFTAKGSDSYAGIKFSWDLPVKIHGVKNLELTKVEMWKDAKECGTEDCFRFSGVVEKGKLSLDTPYTIDLNAYLCFIGCSWQKVATITIKSLKVSDVSVDLPGTGAHVDDNYSGSFCFLGSAKLDASKQRVSFSVPSEDLTCDVQLLGIGPAIPASTVCGWFKDGFISGFSSKIGSEIHDAAQDGLIPKLPRCGAVKALPPLRTQFTPGWGDLTQKRLAARVGRTYVLRGAITANRDAADWQFATFDAALAGSTDPVRIASIRLSAQEGTNSVRALWTPSAPGETDLLLDVFRWNEIADEVSPAAIRVRVFPAAGPTSWSDMMIERMSTPLEEAP